MKTKSVLLWLLYWLFIIGLATTTVFLFSAMPPRGAPNRWLFRLLLYVPTVVAILFFQNETSEEEGIGGFVGRFVGFIVLVVVFINVAAWLEK